MSTIVAFLLFAWKPPHSQGMAQQILNHRGMPLSGETYKMAMESGDEGVVALFHQAGIPREAALAWLSQRAATDPSRPSLHVILDRDNARATLLRHPSPSRSERTAVRGDRVPNAPSLIDTRVTLTRPDGSQWQWASLISAAAPPEGYGATQDIDFSEFQEAGLSLLGHALLLYNTRAIVDLLLEGANWLDPSIALLRAGVLRSNHDLLIDPFLWLYRLGATDDDLKAMAHHAYPSQFARSEIPTIDVHSCSFPDSFIRLIGTRTLPGATQSLIAFEPDPARLACNGRVVQSNGTVWFSDQVSYPAVLRRTAATSGVRPDDAWLTIRVPPASEDETQPPTWLHYAGEYYPTTKLFVFNSEQTTDRPRDASQPRRDDKLLLFASRTQLTFTDILSHFSVPADALQKTTAKCSYGREDRVLHDHVYVLRCDQPVDSIRVTFSSHAPYLIAIQDAISAPDAKTRADEPPVRYLVATNRQHTTVFENRTYLVRFVSLSGINPEVIAAYTAIDPNAQHGG